MHASESNAKKERKKRKIPANARKGKESITIRTKQRQTTNNNKQHTEQTKQNGVTNKQKQNDFHQLAWRVSRSVHENAGFSEDPYVAVRICAVRLASALCARSRSMLSALAMDVATLTVPATEMPESFQHPLHARPPQGPRPPMTSGRQLQMMTVLPCLCQVSCPRSLHAPFRPPRSERAMIRHPAPLTARH